MPPLHSSITGYVSGDRLDATRIVRNIPTGRTLIKAWLTIKNKALDADPGLVQKIITTTPVAGVGQITDDGATDGIGGLLFQLTVADTGTLLEPEVTYKYDIQMKYDNGDIATLEYGPFILVRGVTAAQT